VKEKTAKGYTQGEDGTPYQQPDIEERFTGILPQLLNPIDEAEAERLMNDPAHVMQQKFNGRRMLIRKQDAQIHGINKRAAHRSAGTGVPRHPPTARQLHPRR